MKWKLYLATAALILFPVFHAGAQTSRVAYVDIDRVTEKSDKINKAMGNVSNRVEGIQKEIEEKRKRLAELKLEIKKGEGVLADAELKKRRDENTRLEKEVVDLEYEGRRELQKLDTTLFEPMIKTIVLAIQEVAREKNIDLVLRGEAVIYGADAADITDDVVKKLNSPSFNPEQAARNSDKSTSKDSDSDSETSETNSEKAGSASSESGNGAASETASDNSKDNSGNSIIPNLPLRTRPVDRQQD